MFLFNVLMTYIHDLASTYYIAELSELELTRWPYEVDYYII